MNQIKQNENNYTYKQVNIDDLIEGKYYRIGGSTDNGGRIVKYESKKLIGPANKTPYQIYEIRHSGGIIRVSNYPEDTDDIIEELVSENPQDPIYEYVSKTGGRRRRSYRKRTSRNSKKNTKSRRGRNSRKRNYSRRK